jgi:hypothetical protein
MLAIDATVDEIHAFKTVAIFYSMVRYRDTFSRIERSSEICLRIRYGGMQTAIGDKEAKPIHRYETSLFGPQNTVT